MNNPLARRGHKSVSTLSLLEQALHRVACNIPNLHWVTVASVNGSVQTMYDPFGKERPDRISAMTSAILTLGERMFRKLRRGRLTYLALAGDEGTLVVHPIGDEYMLAISTPAETKIDAAIDTLAQVTPLVVSALYPKTG